MSDAVYYDDSEVEEVEFVPQGSHEELWTTRAGEVLYEGPAGTGKTRNVLERAHYYGETVQDFRCLFLRKTLKALRTTVLPLYEEEVLGPNHPAMYGTATRNHRDDYRYPATNAWFLLGGMDDVDKYMSGQFDMICLFEATDLKSEKPWQRLTTRLRNYKSEIQQIVADVNPVYQHHFLNTRAKRKHRKTGEPVMHRICTKHTDNPRYFDMAKGRRTREGEDYIGGKLEALTGSERGRLLEGKWISAEGLIFDTWDPGRHELRGCLEWDYDQNAMAIDGEGRVLLNLDDDYSGPRGRETIPMSWFGGSIDWGYRRPGVFQVWGIDTDRNAYRMCEVYAEGEEGKARGSLEWWADKILPLIKAFRVRTVWADSAEPRSIDFLNDRLGAYCGRDGKRVVIKADKDWNASRDLIQDGLGVEGTDPKLFYVQETLQHYDAVTEVSHPSARFLGHLEPPTPQLEDTGVFCTEHEYPGLTWREEREGRPVDEEPDPEAPRHGIDSTRYFLMGAWRTDLHRNPPPPTYPAESLYYVLGHDKVEKEDRKDRAVRRKARARSRSRWKRNKRKKRREDRRDDQ